MIYLKLIDMVESQIIASVKDTESLEVAIKSKANIIFLLSGNIMNIEEYINRIKSCNKFVFIHLDLIDGLTSSKSGLDYIATKLKPTGIISTKASAIKHANELGLTTIQRIFLIDNAAIKKGVEMANSCSPDAIEILPGVIPKIIDYISSNSKFHVIAGGLIDNFDEVHTALQNGALAVSSGNPSMWNSNL